MTSRKEMKEKREKKKKKRKIRSEFRMANPISNWA